MKKIFKNIGIILLIAFIVMQFFRPSPNKNAVVQTNTLAEIHPTSDSIKTILAKACLDCHSNNTNYPWYSNIQPIAWWLNNHIKEGKKHFNFDEFGSYNPKKAAHKLEELYSEVESGNMPMNSYTWMHKSAKLNETEKKLLINWAKDLEQIYKAKIDVK